MDEQLITPDMSIEEVLDCWLDFIHFFLEHRMACVGCCLSSFDTHEDALEVYGLPQDRILDSERVNTWSYPPGDGRFQ